nr:reverse transcriptase domain-containing protein [Tanacetum cinerariifolium]
MENHINVLRGDFNKQEENLRKNLNDDMRNILSSFFQNQPSTSGTLLSNIVPNPKGEMKAVTTRSGLAYEGRSIPTESLHEKVDEQNTKEILDKEHSNSSGSTIQPSVVPVSILETDVLRTQSKPTIPYPSKLNDQKLQEKATNQMEKFFQIFHDLHFDISFTDALLLMPKFASTIKSLLANKDKLFELAKVSLNENCSAMLLKKLSEKLGDPGKFLIPCDFPGMEVYHALENLGASINLIPLSIWKTLLLSELTPTRMTLELADRSIIRPKGVAKDVFIKVGKFHFPTDFVVVDFEADPRVPLILRRSFLRTSRALIDVYGEEITIRDVLDFQYNPKSSSPTLVSDALVSEKEPIVKSSSLTLTSFGESDFFLEEIEDFLNDDSIPTGIENSMYDPDGDILFLKKLLNEDQFQLPLMDLKLAKESKAKSSIEEPPELELKELPSHLEYAFLEDSNKLPVIIAKNLKDIEREALINVLKSHKQAIAWKISDIKGIDPIFCTHKILMEDDYKPAVQSQRRPVVSPIHCVPKKGDQEKTTFTCPYGTFAYRRMPFGLCNAPGNEFYCFLDGFSEYFRIPIDPQDQEKTTFTCPYGTFSYRRMPFGLCNAPERETEATKDTVHPTNNESTKDVQSSVVQTESPILNSEPVVAPIIEPVVASVSTPKPNQRPSTSFADALILMPKFGPTIKTLLSNKDKLSELARTPSNEHCLAVLLKKLPERTGGPRKEHSQEVLDFSDVITSGNPTPYYDSIFSTTSSTLTPFRESDFLLEEVDAFLALEDDPTSPEVDQSYVDTEGDILLLEAFLNDDPSLPSPNQGNYLPQVRKELKICEAKTDKSLIDEPPEVELKNLPPHLEYAFLEGDDKLPVIIAKDLSVEEKVALITILKSHKRAIAWKLSDIKGIDPEFCTLKILMEDDFEPASLGKPRTLCTKKGGFTVVENKENDLIPTRLVTGWRVCIDYQKLNEATRKDHFPLPFMDQMLERLAGNEYYCFIDGFSGYFQIPIDMKDQEKTTFTCPYGTFAYRRMSFGLCNASGTFQRCMMAIFHDMIEKTMEVFMDDFSVFRNSFQTSLFHLEKMLKWCEDTNLCLNWVKSHFMVKEGIVLGHKISKEGIEVDKAKVEVIAKLPHPTTVKGIRSFLGHAGFYRRFIKDFLKIARPMTRLLEKDTPFLFSKECVEAFQTLKRKLTEAPILIAPDWDLPFELMCDASDFAIGAILGQPYKTPIGCTSYKLVYGKACHLLIELEHKAYWAWKHANFDLQTVGDHIKVQLNELRDQAYENSLIYKEKTKRLHDSKIKDRVFNIDDQVLLFNSRLKIFSGKLKSRWSGPFTISHVFPYGTVELSQIDGPNFKVNGHRLKHYFGEDIPKMVAHDLQTFPKDQ